MAARGSEGQAFQAVYAAATAGDDSTGTTALGKPSVANSAWLFCSAAKTVAAAGPYVFSSCSLLTRKTVFRFAGSVGSTPGTPEKSNSRGTQGACTRGGSTWARSMYGSGLELSLKPDTCTV